MKGYKGFDKNLQCRGFQYEVDKEYSQNRKPSCCNNGFHFCENPLDVLNYYAPTDNNRFCEVESLGDTATDSDDSKVATNKIKIGVEIGIRGLIDGFIKFVFEKTKASDKTLATTGDGANAATTGYGANAATTGDGANAATTGDGANAATTGYRANAATTGNRANAEANGSNAIAASLGIEGKAKAALGCWIVLAEWKWNGDKYILLSVKTVCVDGETIKPDTWYILSDGEIKEA